MTPTYTMSAHLGKQLCASWRARPPRRACAQQCACAVSPPAPDKTTPEHEHNARKQASQRGRLRDEDRTA
ncbi:hypothetical protein E4U53_002123 [Claviceps sorghi]|nr:hypothetical protein E4U53_002123 [Claviceps sorghi]